jgi:hypothetical protein
MNFVILPSFLHHRELCKDILSRNNRGAGRELVGGTDRTSVCAVNETVFGTVKGEKLVVLGNGRERLYTRERAKALAREITCAGIYH